MTTETADTTLRVRPRLWPRIRSAMVAGSVLAVTVTLTGACASAVRITDPPPVTQAAADKGPRQTAIDEAARILASFAGPPGSSRVSSEPAGTPTALDQPAIQEQNPNQVDATAWFIVPGAPQAALGWVMAHPPTGSTPSGGSSGSSGPSDQVFRGFAEFGFTRPAIPASVLTSRQLVVQPSGLSGDRTVIRLDAQVDWLPPKPTGERVPATATAVTVVASNRMNPLPKSQTTPTSTSDPAKVQQIIGFVDALLPPSPGIARCAADLGTRVTLTFTAGTGGATIAVVDANAGGCGDVAMSIDGVAQAPLAGGSQLVEQVDQVLGIH